MDVDIKTTCLTERHITLGARMAPFGGYSMPIQYEGILHEHQAARERVALFDTCHMGEFRISGPNAVRDLENLVSCRVETLGAGRCRYGLLCNHEGGVIDDLLIYRMDETSFMLVVNAGTSEHDFEWVLAHLSPDTCAENVTAETAKLDIQGPGSPPIVQGLLDEPIDGLKFYTFMKNHFKGESVIVSRTGYTGEMGFEIYGSHEVAEAIWDGCLEQGVTPAGLGARDTLRLEMGMPLYGHEMGPDRNAAESGFTRSIATDKTFIGSSVVLDPAQATASLAGIVFEGRRAARAGDRIEWTADAAPAGVVTSGSFGPSVGAAIALAYVDRAPVEPGVEVAVQGARKPLVGKIVDLPFYRQSTARKPLKDFL